MADTFVSLLLFALACACALADTAVRDDHCLTVDNCYFKTDSRTCECEANCHLYDTCCAGVALPPPDASPLPARQCYGRRTRSPLHVVKSCPPGSRTYDGMACLDEDDDEIDVVSNLLVTNNRTKVTYWNKYCARCNGEEMVNLDFWDIEVQCVAREGVDKGFVRRHLTYDRNTSRWGLKVEGDFLPCTVHYSPPIFLHEVKYCNPNIVQACPPNYPDRERVRKCSQAYAERKLRTAEVYFRNVHCAICNGINEKDVECTGMSAGPEETVDESDFREVTEVIFSRGDWPRKEPGRMFECSPGYTFDPFRKKCRTDNTVTVARNSASICGVGTFLLMSFLLAVFL